MGGPVKVSLECRQDVLGVGRGADWLHHTIVGRESTSDRVVAMGSRTVWTCWVNSERQRLGYLSQLRQTREFRAGRRTLEAGYRAIEATRQPEELPFDLTSIMADNRPARRLLERGVPGLPRYQPVCEYVTLTFRAGSRRRPGQGIRRATLRDIRPITECLERFGRRHQFTPCWAESDLLASGAAPPIQDFFVCERHGRIVGCLARWDQRRIRQIVVREYPSHLARWRPVINAVAALIGQPRLPALGDPFNALYLSHMAVDDDDGRVLVDLIHAHRHAERQRQDRADALILGLAADHPMRPAVERSFRLRNFRSILYLAVPVTGRDAAEALDGRPVHVEVGML